ncbi:MAG: hypothetical protein K2X10_12640 [Hyphomicrobiales bacterium]|nr:hypothetical protein [Hyphomicrobiales bacterium]OQW82236.1 MAG: hypothetical protein BVN31_08835 [Proteobacteria bacterium ST_bin15]
MPREERASRIDAIVKTLRNDPRRTKQPFKRILDQIVVSSTSSVIAACERQISELEQDEPITLERV